MKGVIFDIKHCAIHDGPGIRTTVFFKGCPLNCWWCHNPESISPDFHKVSRTRKIGNKEFHDVETIGQEVSVNDVVREVKKDLVFYEESNGGVTFSGGEPLMQVEFLTELARQCKKSGIHTALDTSGYANLKSLEMALPYIDLFLFDLKSVDDDIHIKHTGVSNKQIFRTLDHIREKGKKVIIRYPLIPGINNSEDQLYQLKVFLGEKYQEIHFLPYHKTATHKYKQLGIENKLPGLSSLPKEYLKQIKEDFATQNISVKIGG